MKLIATKQGRNEKYDTLHCVRRDGTVTTTSLPRQGVLPHDLIHYVVESALRYDHGFLGMVANGADFAYSMELAHNPANRRLADQAIHAEAIVESLQAQLWSGAFDDQQFRDGLEGACAMRGLAIPKLDGVDVRGDLFDRVVELGGRWAQVAPHGTLELEMAHPWGQVRAT
jgi:hypothetical protein